MTSIITSVDSHFASQCLQEHLDYFTENVAGSLKCLDSNDFDLIFAPEQALPAGNMEMEALLFPPLEEANFSTEASSSSSSSASSASSSASASSVAEDIRNFDNQHLNTTAPASPRSVIPQVELAPKPIRISSSSATRESPKTVTAMIGTADDHSVESSGSSKRKRNFSETAETETLESSSSSSESSPNSSDSPKDRHECKRARNRLHARLSRQRKRTFYQHIEESAKELQEENQRLMKLLGTSTANSFARAHQEATTESFVQALKKPSNRILNDATLSSIRDFFDV